MSHPCKDSMSESSPEQTRYQALDRVMALAEFALDGRLLHANTNYQQIFDLTAAHLQDAAHQQFCSAALVGSALYEQMWQQLRAGHIFSGVVERQRSDGSRCWLEATYSPVRNAAGEITHVLKVATDITRRHQEELVRMEHLHRLSLVADASHTAVMISDAQSRIVYANGGFTRMFGWQAYEIMGRAPIELLAPHMTASFKEDFRSQLRDGSPIEVEEIVVRKDGQRYWGKLISNPVLDGQGVWQYTVSTITDITSSKMHEVLQHRVLEAMARDDSLMEVLDTVCLEVERIAPGVAASIVEVDAQGVLHPLASPSLPVAYSSMLEGVHIGPSVGSCGTAAWRNQAVWVNDIASDPLWEDYRQLILPLGYQACWSTPICGKNGKPMATFAFYYRDAQSAAASQFHQQLVNACIDLCSLAMEREQSRLRIRQLAFYDALTGLPNRSLLQAKAEQCFSGAARVGAEVAVLFIDLDRFKQVNDSLGHPAGDELLRAVAARMRQVLRSSDIAGRLAGDEFVAVLPECDAEHVRWVIERLQALLAEPLMLGEATVAVSASIGVSMFPSDGRTMEALLHRADMAMYQAKSAGRGRSCFFSEEMNRVAQERLSLEMALRKALQNQELHLHYQPQVDLRSGCLYGVEALARWTHPELGEIAPSKFIPLAEECGLIVELGRWAVDTACQQLTQWRAKGMDVPAVAVNLSPTNFHNLDLPNMIMDTLQRHSLCAKDLTVELTESILLDTNPSTMKTIHAVHANGVRLSMDDFGTGYSSLSYLRRLPVSELKLDRSFVADLEHDEAARSLSRAILGIGKSLQLTVVAEGVETQKQKGMLQEQGYPVAQGYLFARPLAPKDFEDWLASKPAMVGG